MQLFYHPDINPNDVQIIFSKEESRHMARVLRKKEGDRVEVTNGKGYLFYAELIQADQKQCIARVIEVEPETALPYHLHLAVAPTKMNDRYELFLEKATEIGLHEITPVICEHSERKVIKPERFERVLLSAMKQSLHFSLPQLNPATNLNEFLSQEFEGRKFIAHCEENKPRKSLKNLVKPGEDVCLLIGPEGDFSEQEIALALKNGWQPVSLGPSRLRTETAAIVACHTVALANQD